MTSELVARLDGRTIGVVRRARGRLAFDYDADWRQARGAYPLPVSMPLAARTHGHAAIEPFLWGLLPDNAFVLARERRWNEARLIDRLRAMARALPDALADESTRIRSAGLAHPIVARLQAVLPGRARAVAP